MLKTFSGLLLLAASITIMAQTPAFDSDAKTFRLDGGSVSYVFGVCLLYTSCLKSQDTGLLG